MNGQIVNTIILNDTTMLDNFRNDPISGNPYDYVIQIDYAYPQPGIGWGFDGTAFYRRLTLALVMNNVVIAVIPNTSTFMSNQAPSYQAVIDVTAMSPQPTVGWLYNSDSTLSAPPTPGSQAYYQAIVANAITFGNSIIVQAAARNISMGITQAGQTLNVMNYTDGLITCLVTGSLYEAMTQLSTMIADTSTTKTSLSPFITNATLYATLNQIQTYLGIPLTTNPGP